MDQVIMEAVTVLSIGFGRRPEGAPNRPVVRERWGNKKSASRSRLDRGREPLCAQPVVPRIAQCRGNGATGVTKIR